MLFFCSIVSSEDKNVLLLVIGATHGLIEGIKNRKASVLILVGMCLLDALINQSIRYLHFHCKQ